MSSIEFVWKCWLKSKERSWCSGPSWKQKISNSLAMGLHEIGSAFQNIKRYFWIPSFCLLAELRFLLYVAISSVTMVSCICALYRMMASSITLLHCLLEVLSKIPLGGGGGREPLSYENGTHRIFLMSSFVNFQYSSCIKGWKGNIGCTCEEFSLVFSHHWL